MTLSLFHSGTTKLCAALAVSCAVSIVAPATNAWAWGSTGHRIIDELAIRNLPDNLPDFIRSESTALDVGELAREPDRSRGSGSSHDPDLDPGHFVNAFDDGTIRGGPALATLPATREDYDTALRKVGSDEYRAGFLPYSIIDGWQQLVKDFAYWRADVAGEKYAKSDEQRAWFARDRALRESLTIRDLGYWSHFVGDASQPMHASVHYDGWGDYPNPNGFTTQKGTHLHFEAAYVFHFVKEADVQAAVAPYAPFNGTIQARTGEYLAATLAQVVPFYTLEKGHAFEKETAEGKAFAVARLAVAVDQLRDMIADAWASSADARVGYPALSVKDIEAGKVDAYASLYGED